MKMADILRNIADELESKEGGEERSELPGNVERSAAHLRSEVAGVSGVEDKCGGGAGESG